MIDQAICVHLISLMCATHIAYRLLYFQAIVNKSVSGFLIATDRTDIPTLNFFFLFWNSKYCSLPNLWNFTRGIHSYHLSKIFAWGKGLIQVLLNKSFDVKFSRYDYDFHIMIQLYSYLKLILSNLEFLHLI